MEEEMDKVDLALKRIIGVTPAFVRPPYGEYNDMFREVAYEKKQSLVLWDFDSGDSMGITVAQSKAAYKAKVEQNPNTLLALNHETQKTTAFELLPYVIGLLKSKDYQWLHWLNASVLNPILAKALLRHLRVIGIARGLSALVLHRLSILLLASVMRAFN
ncbi:Carbohydrate esterase 4 protein [Tulasnella sp. 419]|nr:Carbohydrate esterase 4 protein [Tulasnella sp. 419]